MEVDRLIRKSRDENRNLMLCITQQICSGEVRSVAQEQSNSVADVLHDPTNSNSYDIGLQAMSIFGPLVEEACGNVWE